MTPFIGIKHLKFLSISMRHKLTFGFLYFDIHYIHVHMFDLTFLTRCRSPVQAIWYNCGPDEHVVGTGSYPVGRCEKCSGLFISFF